MAGKKPGVQDRSGVTRTGISMSGTSSSNVTRKEMRMDFAYLVQKGLYNKEDLSPTDKAFVDGAEFILDEIKDWHEAECLPDMNIRKTGILENLVKEVGDNLLDELEDAIYQKICEMIVVFLDTAAMEDPDAFIDPPDPPSDDDADHESELVSEDSISSDHPPNNPK